MPSIIFDVIIIAILALFAWRGAARGLILTLCGLAAIFVAYFGAQFLSTAFCEPVSNIIRPVILQTIEEKIPAAARPSDPQAVTGVTGPVDGGGDEDAQEQPAYTMDHLLDDIKDAGLFKGIYNFLKEAVEKGEVHPAAAQTPAEAVADYIAKGLAKSVLFALTFLAITVGWFLLSHALDLAFKLPILSQINLIGGLLLGLVEAAAIVVVLVWLGQVLSLIPAEPESPLIRLFTFDNLWKLWEDLPV